MRPEIDGRLAERIREIAALESDSTVTSDGISWVLSAKEKSRILNIAADVLEEYIMAARGVS